MTDGSNHVGPCLHMPCRYYRVYTDPGKPCVEQSFEFVERLLPIPVEQAALVLVDAWSTHYIETWLARAAGIIEQKIAPLVDAMREVGVAVIHAPSPFIVERRGYQTAITDLASAEPREADWPPPAFRGMYRGGEYADFGRDQEPILGPVYERYETQLDIADIVKPVEGDMVISTGRELHEVLRQRRILHLFYAGFAANWCLVGRDYGIVAMNERGYNIILVRDCTTGIECHDTVADLTATEMTVREIEVKYGWSTTSEELLRACEAGP